MEGKDPAKNDNELAKLRAKCEKQATDLHLAGEIGKQLLEANNDLNCQIEANAKEYAKRLEELEQEKYSMQLKLEQKQHMEKSLSEEVENLRSTIRKQAEEHEHFIQTEYAAQISDARKEKAVIQSELDKAQLREKQVQDSKTQLEELLEEANQQLESQVNRMNETCSDEIAVLHSEVASLQKEKSDMIRELGECHAQLEQMEHQKVQLETAVQSAHQEVEEVQCQATSYHNALEKAREEVQDLKTQLDVILMESQDMKKKGNSLFAEVEDRRIEAEKTLISLKVQHSSLQQRFEASQQQLHKLKKQLASFLQMYGGRADTQHVEHLQQQLSAALTRQQDLVEQLSAYESKEKTTGDYTDFKEKYGEDASTSNYVNFLQALLETKDKEMNELQSELKTKRLFLLAKNDDLLQCQRKLYSSQKTLERLQGTSMNLQLRVEELTAKYEPQKMKSNTLRQTRVERLPISTAALNKDEGAVQNKVVKSEDQDEKSVLSTVTNENVPQAKRVSRYERKNKEDIQTVKKETNEQPKPTVTRDIDWYMAKFGDLGDEKNGNDSSQSSNLLTVNPTGKKKKVSVAEDLNEVFEIPDGVNNENDATGTDQSEQKHKQKQKVNVQTMEEAKVNDCQTQ